MTSAKLEYSLYGIVFAVSIAVGIWSERLAYRLQTQELVAKVSDTNQDLANRIEATISELVAWANGMAAVVSLNPNIGESDFSAAAARLGTDTSFVRNISFAKDSVVRRVYPVGPNASLLGIDLRSLPTQTEDVTAVQLTGNVNFSGPVDLVQGGRGLVMRLKFSDATQRADDPTPQNLISIAVDLTSFINHISVPSVGSDFHTVIMHLDKGSVIYGDQSVLEQNPVQNTIVAPSHTWLVATAPTSGWPLLSDKAPLFATITLFRILTVFAVLRAIFALLRKRQIAEDRLTAAIEALDDGFALFDSNDRLVMSNQRYHEIYKTSEGLLFPGASFEEIIRVGVARGQYPDAKGNEAAWISQRLAAHRNGFSVLEQKLDNGRWLKVAERKTKDGGMVGFRVDITELKLATEAAQAADRAKSDFISVLSHELRSPLTVVIGYLRLLATINSPPNIITTNLKADSKPEAPSKIFKSSDDLIATVEEMAAKAHRSAQHLLLLINHLLDFSKIEAGMMSLDLKNLEVEAILTEVDISFREAIEAKGLSFEILNVAGQIKADPVRVRQIFTNLLANAIKFTETGGISVNAKILEKEIIFCVEDTGCGIPSNMIDRVFGRFEQLDASTTRRAGGTGLGLAISKSLVELMGGKIGVKTQHGFGSTFWFTLPLAKTLS